MLCPNCGSKMPEDSLYCEKCGEDIHMVPDFDPMADGQIHEALGKIGRQIVEERAPHPGNRANRLLLLVLAVLGVVMVALLLITVITFRQSQSVSFQIRQAEKCRILGEYSKAAEYYERAVQLDGEDVSLMEKLAGFYYLQNNQSRYEDILKGIIQHKNATTQQREKAYGGLISLLKKRGDFQGIQDLLCRSGSEELMEEYSQYLAREPVLLLAPGTYEELQALRISSSGCGTIYYTTDGTIPDEKSTPYTVPIVLDYGQVTVKACVINQYGVKSTVVTGEYRVNRPIEIPQ